MYLLECECGAKGTVKGSNDPETNATKINDETFDWEGGKDACTHENFTIVGEEDDFDPTDYC